MNNLIGIIGLGFVGSAIEKSFLIKKIDTICYDKYKNGGIGTFEECLTTRVIFLCLPTLYNEETKEYNKDALHEVCNKLSSNNYNGLVILKSTIEPKTTESLCSKYNLRLMHNPEFLTARTAFHDFHLQKHIILGKSSTCNKEDMDYIQKLYKENYPMAKISISSSTESETMKIFVNSFYASKIQLFNEYYLLCQKCNIDYNNVVNLMLKNNWINPMHTDVPGPDKKLSYGGACFPKDTNALNNFMIRNNTMNEVLNSVIQERNKLRND